MIHNPIFRMHAGEARFLFQPKYLILDIERFFCRFWAHSSRAAIHYQFYSIHDRINRSIDSDLSIYLSFYLFIYLSFFLSFFLSINLFTYLSFYLSMYVCLYLSIDIDSVLSVVDICIYIYIYIPSSSSPALARRMNMRMLQKCIASQSLSQYVRTLRGAWRQFCLARH